jgi:exodeoxyribonuclease V alpha subunit
MIWAYDAAKRDQLKVEVFNGEIGTVGTMGLDAKVWNTLKTGFGPRLKRFAVQFTRKPGITVGYGRKAPTGDKYPRNEFKMALSDPNYSALKPASVNRRAREIGAAI